MPDYQRGDSVIRVRVRGSYDTIVIPYAFTVGPESIVGVLYLTDPLEDSYTDGAFSGIVNGTYHIDKDQTEACADNGLYKVCIKVDLTAHKLYGRLCVRKPFDGWDCGPWIELVSW
jgi:hypothetical protein